MILERVRQAFAAYPAQKAVAEKMLELGLSVRDHSVCCGDVDVKEVSLAQNCRVDRRAVTATLGRIRKDPFLNSVFKSLRPAGPLLVQSAAPLGLSVLEIEPPDAGKAGIVADVSRVLAENRISIRQILTQDPELFENPKLFILLSKKPPVKVLSSLTRLRSVKKVSLY